MARGWFRSAGHTGTPFWDRVDRSGGFFECWPWTGPLYRDRRGHVSVNGRVRRVHQVAWELTNGPIPAGLSVLHECDNQPCCNPAHLFLGTQADNVADMIAKGRQVNVRGNRCGSRLHPERLCRGDDHWTRRRPELLPRGDAHPRQAAKLTFEKAAEIRAALERGASQIELASTYAVSRSAIGLIATGKTWVRA